MEDLKLRLVEMDEQLHSISEAMSEMDVTDEEYKNLSATYDRLMKTRGELASAISNAEIQNAKLSIEDKKAKRETWIDALYKVGVVGTGIAGLCLSKYFTEKGFKFEETGSYTTERMKSLMKNYNFFKK